MNFAGPFDSEFSHDSPVSLGGERFAFDSKPGFVQHHASDSHVVVPDAHLLFSGDYTRIGSDLIISGNNQKFVVGNYFKGETRPALSTKDGATVGGHIVDALTGHVHYAQATAAPAAGAVIGTVLKMSGSASVIRNGVSVELQIGAAVQKGDVIQTGSNSSIGMTFVDGSAFGMTSNARMVLNEMIFDPNGSSNSSLMSLVQGTVTFVAGQTAKNGNMRVETPVATMGIRGTAVLVEIAANDGPTKFSVLVEPDGTTGSFNLYDKVTGQLIGTVSQAGQVTFVSSLGIGQPPTAIEQLKTLADQQAEKAIIQQVFQLYFPNYNPDDSNPKMPKFGSNSSGNNLAEILFTTNSNNKQTFLTQIELRFAVTDPLTGITTYQNRIFYNTKAQFSALAVTADQAFVSTTETFKFMDVVRIDDPDIGNAPFYDIGVPFVAGSAVITSAVSTIGHLTEAFLKPLLHINQTTGVVSFDREQFNFLDDGETVTFMIRVTATSGPDTGTVLIPVTITGENDAPTVVVGAATTTTGDVKEDTDVTTSGDIVANGTITFQDVDLTDVHTATVSLTSTASSLPGFVAGTEIGEFTIDPVSESTADTSNHGSVGWHFKLADNNSTLQSLAKDQTITQTYTITIKDDNGVPVTQTVTITITGTNDVPVLTADTSIHQAAEIVNSTNSVVEDVVSGTLTFTDLDLTDTHQAVATLSSAPGAVVWSGGASGIPAATIAALNNAMSAVVSENNTDTNNQSSVTWEFKLPDYLFDFLGHSETLTLIYDVKVADYNNGVATGTYSTQQVTVQITANNDKPVVTSIAASGTVDEDTAVASGDLLKTFGSVTFTDADLTDTHTVQATYTGAAASSGAMVSSALAAALATTALSVPSTVLAATTQTFNWDFSLENSLVQYLAVGETVTATYTIKVTDNSGVIANNTSALQTVTVIITGTNDVPVIDAIAATSLNEQTDTSALTLASPIHVSFSDVDLGDVGHAASITAVTITGVTAGLSLTSAQLIELVTPITATKAAGSSTGSVDLGFSAPSTAFDYLAFGETITLTYTVTVSDGDGGTTPATFDITITGTNDEPVIGVATLVGTVTEDATPPAQTGSETATGTIAFSDVDLTDAHTVTAAFTSTDYSGQLGSLTAVKTSDTSGGIGGLITWTFIATDAALNALGAGQTVEETYTITLDDGHGGIVTRDVVVTITGANDAPVVTVTDPVAVTEGDAGTPAPVTVTVAEQVSVTDIDATDVHLPYVADTLAFASSTGLAPSSGALANLFALNAADGTINYDRAAFDYLAAGQSVTATFTFDASSGPDTVEKSITVTIDGANDAAVIGNPLADDVREGVTDSAGNLVAAGTLSISDVDSPASFSTTVADATGHVNFGTLSLQTDGQYVYSVENSNPSVQALTGVQTHVDVFTIESQDGTSKDISFTINGVTEIASAGADETLVATPDRENFVFNSAFGDDTITGFTLGTDAMVFDQSLFATVADILAAATSSGSDTIITHGADTVTLAGISLAQVQAHQNDLHIV